jgi:hypothetical protein
MTAIQQCTHWVKDNILELIIAAMLAAFFVDYQTDKKDVDEFRDDMMEIFKEHENKITVLYFTLISDPNLTQTQKEILHEFSPTRPRGATIIKDKK